MCFQTILGMNEFESRSSGSVFRKRFKVCGQIGSTSQTGSCGSDVGKAAAMLLELLHTINASWLSGKLSAAATCQSTQLLSIPLSTNKPGRAANG